MKNRLLIENFENIENLEQLNETQRNFRKTFLLVLAENNYEKFLELDKEFDINRTKELLSYVIASDLPIYMQIINDIYYFFWNQYNKIVTFLKKIKKCNLKSKANDVKKINIIEYINVDEINFLKKLGIFVENKEYSAREFKQIYIKLFNFCFDRNKEIKSFEKFDRDKEKGKIILDKFTKLIREYNLY